MSVFRNALEEIGLITLLTAPRDAKLIIIIRMLRLVGFGATSFIFALYLHHQGIPDHVIGLFMTATFVGDLFLSFIFSLIADQIGRKNTLIIGSFMMTLTGINFYLFSDFKILLATAVIGILTPGGGEVGPFRSVEQSALAGLVAYEKRSDIYAWYTFLGVFCNAVGSVIAGHIIQYSLDVWGYDKLQAYRLTFLLFTFVSVLMLGCSLLVTENIELSEDDKRKSRATTREATPIVEVESTKTTPDESTSLLSQQEAPKPDDASFSFLPNISPETVKIVIILAGFFALEAFSTSLTNNTWISYYIVNKFDIPSNVLGTIFFFLGMISSFMTLVGTAICKQIGPAKTVVATHVPQSFFNLIIPFPEDLNTTLIILFARYFFQAMDIGSKHVLLTSVVKPHERTTTIGLTNLMKTLAQCCGPVLTGYLTGIDKQWLCFIIAGCIKFSYDFGMWYNFWDFEPEEEEE